MFSTAFLNLVSFFSGAAFSLVFIQVIDRSFGFDTAVEEAQRAINAAHVEAESTENGVGVVKLMGRYSGKVDSRKLWWSYCMAKF